MVNVVNGKEGDFYFWALGRRNALRLYILNVNRPSGYNEIELPELPELRFACKGLFIFNS